MMSHRILRLSVLTVTVLFLAPSLNAQGPRAPRVARVGIDSKILLQIIRAEDTRRWDADLEKLLTHDDPKIRRRAVLAAGRIGNNAAAPPLAERVLTDRDLEVRQMAAFALGEIESGSGAYALTEVLKNRGDDTAPALLRARAVEALGKIIAAVTSPDAAAKPDDDWLDRAREPIVNTLRFEINRGAQADRLTALLALTAVLRAKPDGVGKLLAQCLDHSDSRVVADALNTIARLRLKEGNDKARGLLKHNDPIVRANAARVLGVNEDKQAYDALLDRALHDSDSRVGISAIRSLGNLKDERAVRPLVERGEYLLKLTNVSRQFAIEPRNELLEIAAALGRLLPNADNQSALDFVKRLHQLTNGEAVEVEVALARIAPATYVASRSEDKALRTGNNWRQVSRRAQALAAIKEVIVGPATDSAGDRVLQAAKTELREMLKQVTTPELAIPDVLGAYASYKPQDADEFANKYLAMSDVFSRASAAELLGERPGEASTQMLKMALPHALRDLDNDAALAILAALAKQKNQAANDALKTALDSKDHLIRRRAVALLKTNGVGDFSNRIGTVQTRNTEADYRRAMARIGKKPTATVVTNKGSFTIEFLTDDATLNVDNFLQLAKRGYFNGQTIPRVVANFVVQAGDPRGDQNGGPGYTIRCEINEVPYERAAVGMALSGKDTGGSQWFVTHSPQPHLDGGYTVFGRVIRGMDVVDRMARGDRIVRVVVNER